MTEADQGLDEEMISKITAIAGRLARVTQERKALEEQEKFLRQRIASMAPLGTMAAGPWTVNVRANRRFDSDLALRLLTPLELEACCVTTVSSSKAKEILPPERYALCQSEGGDPIVRVSQ